MTVFPRGLAIAALAAIAILGRPGAAPAAEAEDAAPGTAQLFDTAQLELVEPGEGLVYSHTRRVPAGSQGVPIMDGRISLLREAREDGDAALLSLETERGERRLDPLPVASGNPVLVIFLESALREVARLTGGSEFYLRNRIKEALYAGAEPEAVTARYDGEEVAAERIVYRPFAGDPHISEFGRLEEMELAFVLSDAVPGRFLSLAAATPEDGDQTFSEEIELTGEVE